MANYREIGYGSSGEDVLDLQKKLNTAGNYGLTEDGIYGNKTQEAVRDYQQKNGLKVDGIAGNQTWGSLYGSGGSSSGSSSSTEVPEMTDTTSEAVKQAQALLEQHLANKPGQYTSTWQEQMNETLQKIMNREEFSYDVNKDALFQMYADQYVSQGKQAAMDVMGQAQAMTGGYGNSYAQQVGQQTYQGYLQGLNDKVPELYQLALNRYLAEGDQLSEKAALMAQMENQDYGRYRDEVSDYMAMLDHLYGRYDTERGFDYQLNRDKVADEQWQKEFDEAKRQYDEQMALSKSKSSGYTGYTGSNNGSNTTVNTTGEVSDAIREKAASFKNNEELADYAYGLSDAGVITEDQAYALIAEFTDVNEKYVKDKNGVPKASYSDMVKSTSGWKVENDGGVNWLWGVDNDAILRAPNNELIRLDNLVDILVSEGMSKKDAKDYVKRLQKNLDI